jgi:hypothetical protein
MSRIAAFAIVAASAVAGCASQYQSARVVAPGKTQVTAAVTRIEFLEEGDGSTWAGDVQVRQGFGRVDGGVRLIRSPGGFENQSQLGVDAKYELTAPGASTAMSIGMPVAVAWGESGSDWMEGILILTPTFFVGVDVSPEVELVFAPKVFFLLPDAKTDDAEVEFGASVGLRVGDATKTWAVHPELSLFRFSEDGEGVSFLSFGVGVSAGN